MCGANNDNGEHTESGRSSKQESTEKADKCKKRKQFVHEKCDDPHMQQEQKAAKKIALSNKRRLIAQKLQKAEDALVVATGGVVVKTCDICGADNDNGEHTPLVCQEWRDRDEKRKQSCRDHDEAAKALGKVQTGCSSWHWP